MVCPAPGEIAVARVPSLVPLWTGGASRKGIAGVGENVWGPWRYLAWTGAGQSPFLGCRENLVAIQGQLKCQRLDEISMHGLLPVERVRDE